jgi:serine/threonine protein kinase
MNRIKHENVVALVEAFDCDKTFYMVLEMCSGGELFDRIEKKETYNEDEARAVILQVNSALHHCHAKDIVHRDLKPENLLYARPEPDETIKLADFGLAYILNPDALVSTACGTPGYIAPEVLTQSGYGKEVDMWALGVVMFILLSGCPPFYDESVQTLFKIIRKGAFTFFAPEFDEVSEDAKDMIRRLLCVNAEERMTSAQVMDHPWIKTAPGHAAHLKHFQKNMKSYNIRRKFRGVVHGVQMLRHLGMLPTGDGAPPAAAAAAGAGEAGAEEKSAGAAEASD